jgi:hypothetical protein
MTHHEYHPRTRALRTAAGGLALLALPYVGYVASTWYRYGRARRPNGEVRGQEASLIDEFMPDGEVAERHQVRVEAPVEDTFAAARGMNLNKSALVRAIFAARTLPARLGGGTPGPSSQSLLDETLGLGWRVLAERPDREVVVGAVTQPWKADVRFRGVDPDAFAAFAEPGYAKIAWTLEAWPLGPAASCFRTQTRVTTTDAGSRARFRRYWAVLSPGILLIRRQSLGLVKREAERRYRERLTGSG